MAPPSAGAGGRPGPGRWVPGLLGPGTGRDPARPALTSYDDATRERVELSGATLGNWVAKTANLLGDGLGLGPGARVAVLLPASWRTLSVLLGCWHVGAAVLLVPPGSAGPGTGPPPDLVLATADRLDEAAGLGALDVLAASLGALAPPLSDLPPGVLDLTSEVRVHGDALPAPAPAAPDDPVLELAGRSWSGRLLAEQVVGAVARGGLGPGDRVLAPAEPFDLALLVGGLLGPLAAGAGVVLCASPDAAALPGRAADERVTATVGTDVAGLRRLDA